MSNRHHVEMKLHNVPQSDGTVKRTETFKVPLSWEYFRQLCEAGIDPARVVAGQDKLTGAQVVDAVAMGIRLAGCPLKSDEISELVIRHGMIDYAEVVGEVLGGLVCGGIPKVRPVTDKEAKPKKSKAGRKSKARSK